jgi:glutamate racemase
MEDHPIGMFDSGIGGLTVMSQLVRVLPLEHMVYFGDTARLPYGAKSPETIIRYSIENAIFLIRQKIKVLVVACNTASAHALEHLQQIFSIPVIGVIHPGAKSAVESSKTKRIAVLGTKGTINSQSYQKAILQFEPKAQVFPVACPLFVPFVEEGCLDHPAARLIVEDYLRSLKHCRIDTLLLGCTHYPLLKDLIRREIGEDIMIIDSAVSCAEAVAELLSEKSLCSGSKEKPVYRYYVSDDPQKFQLLGSSFLGRPIDDVSLFRVD